LAGVNSACRSADVFAVPLDQLADFASLVSGVGACVGDGPAQPNIIAYECRTVGVGK